MHGRAFVWSRPNLLFQILHIFMAVRHLTCQDFPKENSKREAIASFIVRLAHSNLRGHISRAARHFCQLVRVVSQLETGSELLRQPEVKELDIITNVKSNVLGLDISVDNLAVMQVLKSMGKLIRNGESLFVQGLGLFARSIAENSMLSSVPSFPLLFYPIFQRIVKAVHDNEVFVTVWFAFGQGTQLDNVGVLDIREHSSFNRHINHTREYKPHVFNSVMTQNFQCISRITIVSNAVLSDESTRLSLSILRLRIRLFSRNRVSS
mmetsp:Transcript_22243/g.61799  ORF Transcript_22243/g.61799 Transcript_22243/m.61799 type:complete len:265 (-) Transcript_22243:344-1138(-)